MKKFAAVACTTLVTIASLMCAPTTVSAASSTSIERTGASSEESPSFSDADAVAFLTNGSGPIGRDHPELRRYFSNGSGDDMREAESAALLEEISSIEPRLSERITEPLQSGDPYAVESALSTYQQLIERISKKSGSLKQNAGEGRCVVVLAAGILIYVAVATKFWATGRSAQNDAKRYLAADLASAFAK